MSFFPHIGKNNNRSGFKAPAKIQDFILYRVFSCLEVLWEIFNNICHIHTQEWF